MNNATDNTTDNTDYYAEILTAALSAPKPKRAALYAALRDIARREPDQYGARTLDAGTLRDLLAHFVPSRPNRARDHFSWVAMATAGNRDIREHLRFVYCDGERIIGTDGHRLHVAPAGDRPAGYYDPRTGDPVILDAQYPDVDRIIPEASHRVFAGMDSAEIPADGELDGRPYVRLPRHPDRDKLERECAANGTEPPAEQQYGINRAYLTDALALHKSADVYQPTEGGTVRLEFTGFGAVRWLAVIMPMRLGPVE